MLALEEWAAAIFGQTALSHFDWPLEIRAQYRASETNLLQLAELFESPIPLLDAYSDTQIDQAFWFFGSDTFLALCDESADWTVRRRLIRSFEPLFRQLFATRCTPCLGHRSEEGSPLNSSCYMWWDFDWKYATPDPLSRNRLDSEFLSSMRSILSIDHAACQESALHGLGHWHRAHGEAVERIIDEFLARESTLRSELRQYALAARSGCIP